MSSLAAQRSTRSGPWRFAAADIAFALAWEIYAPGLGGWTVHIDLDEGGDEFMLVDPPLVYGDGFVVRLDGNGAVITSPDGLHRAANLREAMLLICPLSPDALQAVEKLALAPAPSL